MIKADTEQRIFNVYTADSLGMIIRYLYGTTEFQLYSDFINVEEEKSETKEEVIEKILSLLGKVENVGKEG